MESHSKSDQDDGRQCGPCLLQERSVNKEKPSHSLKIEISREDCQMIKNDESDSEYEESRGSSYVIVCRIVSF